MRAAACSVAILVVLVAAGTPAVAHPFPRTMEAAKTVLRDTLSDADEDAASALLAARALLRELRDDPGAPLPTVPLPAPADTKLEVRTVLVQPGIQGRDELLSVLWVGAREDAWRGAYWIRSSEGTTFPGLIEADQTGVILLLDGGAYALTDSVDATYHFLSEDGTYTTKRIGTIPLLPAMPVLDRADLGGAIATEGSASHPAAILLTPWNLFGENATIGVTLRAGETEIESITAPGCEDIDAGETEPGCRHLYALPLAPGLTHLEVWHLEGDDRVVDRELTRAQLLAGWTFDG